MAEFSHIGKRVPKLDACDKATGRAVYGHDVRLPRMLHAKILRSAHAHARIVSIDTSRAEQLSGVRAVVTGKDLSFRKFGYGRDHRPLKVNKVRYYGDEVAAVAAVDPDTAAEALELIQVEYEPLPAVFDPREALKADAPIIHEDRESNLFTHYSYSHGDVDRALDEADVVVEGHYELRFQSHACLETSFCLASFDHQGNLTMWSTTQIPFLLQRDLSEALGMPGSKVRIIQTAIGGAFGRGLDMYPHEPICAFLAKVTGQPVRIAFSRQEEFIGTPTRQPLVVEMRSGARKDGTLLVRDVNGILDAGAYISWGSVEPLVMMEAVGSLYRLPHARFEADVVYTNNPYSGAMRGFGNPQASFFVESQMDELAEALGMDPLEFRLRNANRPYETTPQGLKITSCGLRECLERAAEGIGWERRSQAAGRRLALEGSQGKSAIRNPSADPSPSLRSGSGLRLRAGPKCVRRGIGIAATLNVGGGARIYRSDGCGSTVKVDDFGRVTLVTGASEIGQGSETVLAQIVAEELGVSLDQVEVVNTDTSIKPWDVGVHASRTTFIAGKSAQMAASDARAQILEEAAIMLEVAVTDLEIQGGQVMVKGVPDSAVSFDRVVRARHFKPGGKIVLGEGWYDPPNEMLGPDFHGNISSAYSFGAQAAEVEVDIETGQVKVLRVVAAHDVGRAINPMYVEGQIEGGVHMGLGYALTEELLVKEGRVLNPIFLDYRVPTTLDTPAIETIVIETVDPEGPFGAKGVGEMGCNPTAAAITNAVYDAIGVRINSLPITPEKVLRALTDKEAG